MENRLRNSFLAGILICLLIIAFKPQPNTYVNAPGPSSPQLDVGNYIVNISNNRIGVVDSRNISGMYGKILIFDYDEKNKTFKYQGFFDYSDYFSNPQNHGLLNNN